MHILPLTIAAVIGATIAGLVQEHRVRVREHDTAYGVLNRAGIEARLRGLRGPVDIVYCDMDNFHQLNDALGQDEVDRLMRQALHLRSDDLLCIGRWKSGDELLIVVRHGQGAQLAARLQAQMRDYGMSATFGVCGAHSYQTAIEGAYQHVWQAKHQDRRGQILTS